MNTVLQHLHRAAGAADPAAMTDAELLGYFIDRRDPAAFEALVRRHGPMVLGVCRRVLRHDPDAEDAFQATFLVLVRKATSVSPRALVGNWLYGVAYQTAVRARALVARRHARERQVADVPEVEAPPQDLWDDLQPLLDRELSGLPDRYRVPLVLCDLEGKTRKEAARQLGWPEGTVSGRLSRARALLADRLRRRGVALSAGVLGVLLGRHAARAAVPASLLQPTVKAAALLAAGKAAAGAASAQAVALAEGVVKAMLTAKLKIAGVVLVCVVLFGIGASTLLRIATADAPAPAATRPGYDAFAVQPGDAYGGAASPGGQPDDDQEVWTLEFLYESLTLYRLDAPGVDKQVLVLRYEVTNNTGQPRHFVPTFTLQAGNEPPVQDQLLRKELPEIAKVGEAPDLLERGDSVSIAGEPLRPSAPAVRHPVRGVALWPLPDTGTRRFSIFVTGLSNAWQAAEPLPPAPEPLIRRKTLRLDFQRAGDTLTFVPPARWVYRPAKGAEGKAGQAPGADQGSRAAEINKAEAAVARLEEQRKNWRKERAQLQGKIQAGDADDVNRQAELELLNKRLEALRQAPAEERQGAVLEIFDEKLLLVSLGADQGLRKGDRLAIFRLEPKPLFVGEAEVLNVGPKSSVARLTKALPGQSARAGDRASTAPAEGGAILERR